MHSRILCGSMLSLCMLPVLGAPQIVAEGRWETLDYEVSGTWRIVRDGAEHRVELDEDFETKNGPDLHIVLSKERLNRITNENATERALIVGLLKTTDDSTFFKKMKGAQSLPLPPATNLSEYRSILIHCVKFSHLWAGAPL